jgi:hypothetical protein
MRAPKRVAGWRRGAAHVLGAAADGDVAVAQQDGLAGADDGLQARAAQAVDVHGRRFLGAAAVDGRHAREVHVARLGVDHVAEHHVAHVLALDAGAGDGLLDHGGGQVDGGDVLQAAAKGSDGGAHTAGDDDFTAHDARLLGCG